MIAENIKIICKSGYVKLKISITKKIDSATAREDRRQANNVPECSDPYSLSR